MVKHYPEVFVSFWGWQWSNRQMSNSQTGLIIGLNFFFSQYKITSTLNWVDQGGTESSFVCIFSVHFVAEHHWLSTVTNWVGKITILYVARGATRRHTVRLLHWLKKGNRGKSHRTSSAFELKHELTSPFFAVQLLILILHNKNPSKLITYLPPNLLSDFRQQAAAGSNTPKCSLQCSTSAEQVPGIMIFGILCTQVCSVHGHSQHAWAVVAQTSVRCRHLVV